MEIDPNIEALLRQKAEPILRQGRKGDWEHTQRALAFGRRLLQSEPAQAEIVIPALYLHDTGWSRTDFSDFLSATPAQKKHTRSLALHMGESAALADAALRELDWPDDQRERIVAIIAVHDEPEKVFAMGDLSATVVVEADRLDRYGKESLKRYERMFGPDYWQGEHWQEAKAMRIEGLRDWFRTPTGRSLAHELAREMGLIEQESR